jgi:prepilin-type N-terminal cleavage/methylation domain-containing protein
MKEKATKHNWANVILTRAERGMTVLEMLVAMIIFSLVIFAACRVYGFAYRDWADGIIAEQLQYQVQDAMIVMETDVKQAQYTTIAVATYPNAINVTTSGRDVVLYEMIPTISTLYPTQVHLQFLLQNLALRRGVVAPVIQGNGVATFTTYTPATWTTLLPMRGATVSGVTTVTTVFTIGTANPNHPTLKVATLTLSNVSRPNISVVFNPEFSLQGNIGIQEGL